MFATGDRLQRVLRCLRESLKAVCGNGPVRPSAMSNPYNIGNTQEESGQLPELYHYGTAQQPEFGPYFDTFLPVASPTPEEERLAAVEEDKRSRNTAASARFRVKKKEKEQALEQTTTSMKEKVARLEERVRQLDLENGWLRDLITEKRKEGAGPSEWQERSKAPRDDQSEGERSPNKHTDGVGTAS